MTEDPISGVNAGTQDVSATDQLSPKAQKPVVEDFKHFGLSQELLQAITEAGYTKPTPIQAEGIPPALERRDLIGIAQTGTGKTASFALPMIELLSRGRARARMPRSLILEPTRELAAQVAESFEAYTKYQKLSMALLIGGTSFDEQDRKLDRGADVLIATPGRLLDHFERGKLMLSQTQILVIDEADRMLDMGFIPDIERICKLIPFTRQTLFYSATMPTEIRRLTEQFLQNPVQIEVARPATTAANITQTIVDVPGNDWAKREALRRLIDEAGDSLKNGIVFCNRKHDVDIVARSLKKHGYNAAPLHGDLDQSLRMQTLDRFRSDEIQILVASDVAARGLDIPDVSHVFNFDVPFHSDDYVHRIGRTGRAGRSGITFMLVTPRDEKYVEAIEKLTKNKQPRRELEGLADAIQERPARGGRGGRDRGRGRDRDRGRGRKRPENRPEEITQAVEPTVKSEARSHSAEKKHTQESTRNQKVAEPRRDKKRDTRRSAPKAPEPFGADLSRLPAFLLRPVPVPKTFIRLPEEEEELEALEAQEEQDELEVREAKAPRKGRNRKRTRRRGKRNGEAPVATEAKPETSVAEEKPSVSAAETVAVAKPAEKPVKKAKSTASAKKAKKPVADKVKTTPVPQNAPAPKAEPVPKAEPAPQTAPVTKAEPAPKAEPVPQTASVPEMDAPAKKVAAKKTTKKATAKKATTKKAAAKKTTKKATTKKAATKKAAAKKTTAKKATTKKAAAKKTTAKKAVTKKATTEKAPAKKAATKKTTAKKTTTKKAAVKKAATKKATAKKAPAKKTATKKVTAKKAPAKKAATKKAATKKTVAKKATAKKTTRKRTAKKAVATEGQD